jgi:hypothetical protein
LLRLESGSLLREVAGDDGGKKRKALLIATLIILIRACLVLLTRFNQQRFLDATRLPSTGLQRKSDEGQEENYILKGECERNMYYKIL